MKHISIDLETYSSVPIQKAGLYKYVQSPDFEILLFAYSVDGGEIQIIDFTQGEYLPQWLADAVKSPEYVKHAYNAAFEWYCLSKYYGALLPIDQWRDTQLHSLYCGYPSSLEKAGEALGLPEEKQKLSVGKSLIRYFCIPCAPTKKNGGRMRNLPKHDPDKWRLFKVYCKGDVKAEMEIERRLSAFPVPYDVEKQWQTDLRINSRGALVDMEMVRGAIEIGNTVRRNLIDEAVSITGLDNPNSVQQLSAWLEKETDEDITNLRKETVAYMLDKRTVTGAAERILEIRQELGKTSTKKYDAINTAVCSDGRVRGLLQFYGANRTGRWAGRFVQVQNLPRTYIGQLPFARKAVSEREPEKLRAMYGSVPDTLSQLIRTSFVSSEGNTLIDADFSAIEARVIAWLAKEQWKLDVFRTHGKIYEASASQMFGVPIERIKKGNPEYALRQRGKVAELALGYQGGVPAMRKMDSGHQLDDLSDDEIKEIVTRWRETNKRIVGLWYSVENAAVSVIQTGKQTGVNGLLFTREFDINNNLDFMTITLPSKRKLFYIKPKLGENQWGKPSIVYYGVNQKNKQWSELETYGGKLVENCLAGDTPVLTSSGIVALKDIKPYHKIWDGKQWVSHGGLISRGLQKVISVDGIKMTEDHLIYTKEGWTRASSSERHNRYEVQLPNSDSIRRLKREKVFVEDTLRLRKRNHHASKRISERKAKIMRLYAVKADRRIKYHTRAFKTSIVPRLALNERALFTSNRTSMGELRRSRDYNMRSLAEQLREFLGGYVPQLSARADFRPHRCERKLLSGKLPLGFRQAASAKQKIQSYYRNTMGAYDNCGSVREIRYQQNDFILPRTSQLLERFVVRTSGHYEQVYDLKNAGPNHCFTVMSDHGPMLVHNCIQAIARDCLAIAIQRLESAGFPIVFHVHDEVVIDIPREQADLAKVVELMTQPIPWAPDLPLNADGWVGDYFRKD